ncbi:MAG: site-specific DNA-methyltransferase [Halobacteriales archaeon]
METEHGIYVGDSRQMDRLGDDSVELVVTSPPYPMIEMWDEVFGELNPEIGDRMDDGEGKAAFQLMHEELEETWQEVSRVLVDGGIACINIGDATRKVDGRFRVYQNHARIIDAFEALGFDPLPDILWRKPVNSAAKFMGSGMLPPNAYATLEHEYILVFRNGRESRTFEPKAERRYNAAYFWEERNEWFSDVWLDIRGTLQRLNNNALRERSAAYPLEIPYRLISMYSVYGDTVLDPFWGTGTSSLAAMVAGRNSVGYERQEEFTNVFRERVDEVGRMSREIVRERLSRHRSFAEAREADGDPLGYSAANYDFPVMTEQERNILFYVVDAVESADDGYVVTHSAVEGSAEFDRSGPDGQSTLGTDFSAT